MTDVRLQNIREGYFDKVLNTENLNEIEAGTYLKFLQ